MSIMESFASNVLEQAIDIIAVERYDVIRCSLTGRIYGRVFHDEIRSALRVELARNPLADAESLADTYALKYAILCTQPAPAFRVIKDYKHLLTMMRNEVNGRVNIFCFVAGRLFYEHLVREQDIDSWTIRSAKVSFLAAMQDRLLSLPSDWWNSLTAQDEEVTVSDEAIRMLSEMTGSKPTVEEESKAAQRCFEALLRIDGIHNIKNLLFKSKLLRKLIAFRESEDFSFLTLLKLLNQIEADTVARMEETRRSPDGNAMLFFLAIDTLQAHGKRVEKLRELFEDKWRKGVAESRLSNLWSELRAIGLGKVSELEEARLTKLHNLMNRANMELNVVTFSEKRRDYLESFIARRGAQIGNVQTIHGARALKDMANSGIPMKPALKEKLTAYQKAGVISKSTPKQAGPKKPKSVNRQMIADAFKGKGIMESIKGFNLDGLDKPSRPLPKVPTLAKKESK